MNLDQRLRMVVGMSRAGTTSMCRALNLRGDVAAYGETGFWGGALNRPAAAQYTQAELIEIANIYGSISYFPADDLSGSLPASSESIAQTIASGIRSLEAPASPVDLFRVMGSAVASACGRRYWVEKTPYHLLHVDDILSADPGALIVVMLRSPQSFMLSYKHQGDRKPGLVRENFHRLYHPALASLVCRKYMKAASAAKLRYPDNVMVVTLEKLKGSPKDVLEEVCRHLQLDPLVEVASFPKSNSSFADGGPKQVSQLTKEDKQWLYLMTSRYAPSLGLEASDAELNLAVLLLSCAKLAIWPFRNIRALLAYRGGLGVLIRRWMK